MKTFLAIFAVCVVVVAFSLAFIGIKMLVKKNGEFKRHCSSVDPYTGERIGCVCGHSNILTSDCKSEKHTVLEVDKDLLRDALK